MTHEQRLARRRELYGQRRETDPEWVERIRKRQREWYRAKYREDEDFAQRERDRCYWDLSGFRYNRKLLKDRSRRGAKRVAARTERYGNPDMPWLDKRLAEFEKTLS